MTGWSGATASSSARDGELPSLSSENRPWPMIHSPTSCSSVDCLTKLRIASFDPVSPCTSTYSTGGMWQLVASFVLTAAQSMCTWVSIKPGNTTRPAASMTRVPLLARPLMSSLLPTATIRSPLAASACTVVPCESIVTTFPFSRMRSGCIRYFTFSPSYPNLCSPNLGSDM